MSERGLYLAGGADSCLLLPGLSSADGARRLAEELNQSGFTVSAPDLFFCHETLAGFSTSNWRTWLDEAREAYMRLDRSMASVSLVGIGLGGTLAVILAAEYPVLAAVLVAPVLRMPGFQGLFNPPPACEGGTGGRTARLRDEWAVNRLARRSLFAVVAPLLIVEPERGGFVHPSSAKLAYSGVSSREKRIEWLAQSRQEFPCEAEFQQALDAIMNHLRHAVGQKRL
jgi:esterase/lipase